MGEALRMGVLTPLIPGDPRVSGDFANLAVRWQTFEPVFLFKAEGRGVESCLLEWPLLAEPEAGGLTVLSARVVPGRRFWNGAPVTAEAIRDSLEKTPLVRAHAEVAVRDGRVFFLLMRRHAQFDLLLANHNAPIVAPGAEPIGTGPYVLQHGPPSRLVRNPHHPLKPLIEEVRIDVYPLAADGQPRALIDAVNEGRVDFTSQVPYSALPQLQNVRKLSSLGYCTCSLFFNTEKPLLADARVRRALAHAVDRQGIAAACYANPLAFVARGLLPPLLGHGEAGIVHAPAEARRLLAEAGVGSPPGALRLLVMPLPRPYLPDPQAVARKLVQDFAAVGWRVEAQIPAGLSEYMAETARGAYDLALQGWSPDSQDPLEYVDVHLASRHVPAMANDIFRMANLGRYRSAAMDQALAAHRAEGDPASWQEIMRLLSTDLPLLPIMYGPSVAALSWRITRRPQYVLYRAFLAEMALGD